MRWALRVRGWRGAHSSPHTSRTAQAAHSAARPRVTRAVQAAQMAQAGVTRGMGSAMAGLEALFAPAVPAERMNGISGMNSLSAVGGGDASLGSAVALQLPAALMRETTRAARLTGRRPEDVLTEALTDWLAGYSGAAGTAGTASMAPSPLYAPGRRHSWGEIEETLRALRAS